MTNSELDDILDQKNPDFEQVGASVVTHIKGPMLWRSTIFLQKSTGQYFRIGYSFDDEWGAYEQDYSFEEVVPVQTTVTAWVKK